MRTLIIPIILNLAVITAGCVTSSPQTSQVGVYYTGKTQNFDSVLQEITIRNSTIEKHPAWLVQARQDFMLKKLEEVPQSDYQRYAEYLDEGVLYIIVHPAYSVFFNDREPFDSPENPVDAFLDETSFTREKRFLQEQERSLRDFLEITSTRKRLVVLVMPGNYREYQGFVYRDLPDEYARYVNSVTNSSESVLYLYSERPNRGNLSDASRKKLLAFIRSVNPKTVVMGGGYLGRCVEDTYRQLSASLDGREITVAAEITAISREDLKNLSVGDFLRDGKLDVAMLKEVINSSNMKGGSLRDFLRNYRNYRVQKRAND